MSPHLRAGEDPCPSSVRQSACLLPFRAFCSFQSFQAFSRLDEAHPQWGEQSALPRPLIQLLISSRNTLTRHTQSHVNQTSGHPMSQLSCHIKVIIIAAFLWASRSEDNTGQGPRSVFPYILLKLAPKQSIYITQIPWLSKSLRLMTSVSWCILLRYK